MNEDDGRTPPHRVRESCPWTPVFCVFCALTLWFLFTYVTLHVFGNRKDLRDFLGPTVLVLAAISLLSFSGMMRWCARHP